MSGDVIQALRGGHVAQEIRRRRLVVVLRRVSPRPRLLELVDTLAKAGARIFEVTFDATSAADDVRALRAHLGAADGSFLIGAGTILAPSQLDAAQACGADFGVAPLFDRDVLDAAVARGFPFVPGAFTPTEIHTAWEMGATFVKLFPASAAGPQLIRELRGPLPEIEIIPTGGVDASNAEAFLGAGAVAVGIGSALVRAAPVERRELVARLVRS